MKMDWFGLFMALLFAAWFLVTPGYPEAIGSALGKLVAAFDAARAGR